MPKFYFSDIFSHLPTDIEEVIVVTHLVPGVDEFIAELNKKIKVAALIPKPNSIDPKILSFIEEMVPLLRITRQDIKTNPDAFIDKIDELTKGSRFAIIDTGGYFSHVLFDFPPKLLNRLAGIVEDTENGHQKYANLLLENGKQTFPCPVISVARSSLKDPEDYLVGQAVAFSAEALLREFGQIIASKKALVFGYGKIGSSLAHNLRVKGAIVTVIDTNPVRQALALAHGFASESKKNALRINDLIFGATGNKSICPEDLPLMKSGTFVFTATSGDDEIKDYDKVLLETSITDNRLIRQTNDSNSIYICNDGNSANFMHGGILGPFIKLVQAELAYALSHLRDLPSNCIAELPSPSKAFIAESWINSFARSN